jgi:hypothetical protein
MTVVNLSVLRLYKRLRMSDRPSGSHTLRRAQRVQWLSGGRLGSRDSVALLSGGVGVASLPPEPLP